MIRRRIIIEKYVYSGTECIEFFETLGKVKKYECEKKIIISDEYGNGQIRFIDMRSLRLTYFDFTLKQDLKLYYDIDYDAYKVILPIEGDIIAEKNDKVLNKAIKDKLLITIPNDSLKTNPSLMYIPKGKYYKSLSIAFDDSYFNNIYIKNFKEYWNAIVDKLTNNRKQMYCTVDVNYEIKTLFLNLLPDNKIDISNIIDINSKVYEIIFKLKEINNKEQLKLNQNDIKHMESLKKYLENNVLSSEENINLEALARKFSVNRDKMQKIFKKMYGETIFGFYRRIKLEKAFVMLKEDDFSVQDIAHMLNYNSISSFRLAFKKHYGILPSKIKLNIY